LVAVEGDIATLADNVISHHPHFILGTVRVPEYLLSQHGGVGIHVPVVVCEAKQPNEQEPLGVRQATDIGVIPYLRVDHALPCHQSADTSRLSRSSVPSLETGWRWSICKTTPGAHLPQYWHVKLSRLNTSKRALGETLPM
jgi:hypothetical protein